MLKKQELYHGLPLYPEYSSQDNLAASYCRSTELIEQRGWTASRIKRDLKIAAYARHPKWLMGPHTRLYKRDEVERIETTPEWQELKSKRKSRSHRQPRTDLRFAILKAEAYAMGLTLRNSSKGGYEVEVGEHNIVDLHPNAQYFRTLEAVRYYLNEIDQQRDKRFRLMLES